MRRMTVWALAAAFALCLCVLAAHATPVYKKATRAVQIVNTPHNERRIVIVEVADTIFDLAAKDIWVFQGPVPQRPGVAIGIGADGKEIRAGVPTAEPAAGAPASQARLASLTPACASCHTAGQKVKGGFTLFVKPGELAKEVSWKEVLEVVEGKGKDAPRMPPADSGKPPVSKEDLAEIRRLSK